ncbi:MAG: TnsD family transposase [Blautia sp.]|nr:TnsD family transposase [Blautia sp.]
MQRLSFFPTPYPDECFYSIFCRYYVRSGISSSEAATRKFFRGDRSLLVSTVYFPRKLELLDYWVDPDSGITGGDLICGHTSYPYHSVSHVDELYRQMEEAIRDGVPEAGIDRTVRRMMSKSKYASAGQYLRYCPACAREDFRRYGEAYWHRLPQLPGVACCPEHGCRIRDSDAPFEEMRVRIYPASYVLRNVEDSPEGPLRYGEDYLFVARETAWLLEHGREFGGHRGISRKYRACMVERGYADFRGTICDRAAFVDDFRKKYSDGFISEILPYGGNPLYWLRYLQESIGFNLRPLHHILLMGFFAGSAREFMCMEVEPLQPYGSGPWPCANSLCAHYKEEVAERTDIQKMGSEIWAWFECPHCGMKYRRTKHRQPFEKYLQEPCISDRGFLYRQKLEECLSDKGMTVKAISERLGTDARTVVEYARKNGIDLGGSRKRRRHYKDDNARRERTEFYRMRIMEELQERQVLSCKDLKGCIPGAYEWMIEEDAEWLHSKLTHEYDKPRWQEWGEAALIELKAAYAEIQASGDHRKRVNISWLAKVAGLNRDEIYGRLPHLPEMQEFLGEACETQEEWIRRRYTEVALEKKKAGGKEFTYNDVKRKVQIRRGSYDRNRLLIEELIAELNATLFMD